MSVKRIEVARDLWRMIRVLLRDGNHIKHDSTMREAANIFEDELYNPPKSEQGDSKNNVQQTKYAIPESCKECGHLGQCGATHATIACLTMLKFRESVHL